jgi:hypothetical protein
MRTFSLASSHLFSSIMFVVSSDEECWRLSVPLSLGKLESYDSFLDRLDLREFVRLF